MSKCIFVKEIEHFRESNSENFPPAAVLLFPRFARILVPGLPPRLRNSDVPPNFRASRGSAVSLNELVVPSLSSQAYDDDDEGQ